MTKQSGGAMTLRLSEFAGKKIINIYDGGILGLAGESDLVFDPQNGGIEEIILPPGKLYSTFGSRRQIVIPWESVRKISSGAIVVDVDEEYE